MSSDLPVWWEAGTHDRDLLIGAAKHGVSRTDYHIMRDPDLSFMAAQRNYSQTKTVQQQQSRTSTPLLQPQHPATSSVLTGSPLPPLAQRDTETGGVVPKVEPTSEGEESKEKQGESWSLPPVPSTPTGLEEKPVVEPRENERQMVAARTKPLTPNSSERKPKKASKRGRREARRGSGSDSDGSSSSSSSRSSSTSSSSSSTSSHSGSSSSSSSSCSSGSSSSSSSSSSDDSESEREERKKKKGEYFLNICSPLNIIFYLLMDLLVTMDTNLRAQFENGLADTN